MRLNMLLRIFQIINFMFFAIVVTANCDNDTHSKPSVTLCQQGDIYSSLLSCINFCTSKQRVKEDSHTATTVSHKIVIFNATEYQMDSKGNLFLAVDVPIRHFGPQSYIIKQNQAFVCYPINAKLKSCLHEILKHENRKLFKLSNNQRNVQLQHYGSVNLSVDNFYKRNDGIVICKYFGDVAVTLSLIGFTLSDVALIMTGVMVNVVPSLRKRNNESLLWHMWMVFIIYCILTFKIITPINILSYVCPTIALVQQFSYLAAFTWLNVLLYSLYKAFISFHPLTHMSSRRIRLSYLYAFGVPFLITVVTGVAQQWKPTDWLDPHLEDVCWFSKSHFLSACLYFHGPMACALIINIVFFLSIVFRVKRLGKEVVTVNKHIRQQIFRLSVKLALIMGLGWAIAMAMWIMHHISDFWKYLEVLNSLQGVFILLVYAPTPSQFARESKAKKRKMQPVFYFQFNSSNNSQASLSV